MLNLKSSTRERTAAFENDLIYFSKI